MMWMDLVLAIGLLASVQEAGLLGANVRIGDRLTVVTQSGTRVNGRLLRDDAGALALQSDGRERTIAHADIVRVDRRRNRFLFGPLLGLGAGLAAGLPLKTRFDNEAANGSAWLGLMVGLGVGVGSVVDLLNGSERTVYMRPPGERSRARLASADPPHR